MEKADTKQPANNKDEVRLNKLLSDRGVCSRREADRFITQGRIYVDEKKATLGMKIKENQRITLDGKEIEREKKLVLLALNKPKGIVCTTEKKEPNNIIDYIHYHIRIYPIGRLDKDSEGLILLTNEGEIMDRLLRGSNQHEKEYVVRVNRNITQEFLKGMAEGVPILDTITRPCKITPVSDREFRIILTQGLNRQIRRMCEYFGYHVLMLKRERIMNIRLGHLKTGQWRKVTLSERKELFRLLGISIKTSKY